MKHPLCELLAPAGNLEKLKIAVHYGADAVYLGGKHFSLRAQAGNFNETDLAEAVSFCHNHQARLFVTVNIFAHNRDFNKLDSYLRFLAEIGVDGLIISDPGIIRLAKKIIPAMSLHLSTQANVTNWNSALFWQEQGVSRINPARELGLAEIKKIKEKIKAKIEIFVHGALCISYSGRCMLSLYLTGRDANQGLCAHPCRYSYRLEERKRPGQYFPVEEDKRGTYIFNSKDLCLINRLPELLNAGVDSLKIEGRMKGIYYAGGMEYIGLPWIISTSHYRKILTRFQNWGRNS
jgi:putative protease